MVKLLTIVFLSLYICKKYAFAGREMQIVWIPYIFTLPNNCSLEIVLKNSFGLSSYNPFHPTGPFLAPKLIILFNKLLYFLCFKVLF